MKKLSEFATTLEFAKHLQEVLDNSPEVINSPSMYLNKSAVLKAVGQMLANEAHTNIMAKLGETPKPVNALEKLGITVLLAIGKVDSSQ